MKIWVDADACPKVIKDILFRAAERRQVEVTLVANHALPIPPTRYVTALQVPQGFDVADNEIIKRMAPGDLVITADIPLAAEVIDNDGTALNPRGELYTTENVRQRLAMRDLMEQLRSTGEISGGPATLSKQDRQAFANQLDRALTRALGAGQ